LLPQVVLSCLYSPISNYTTPPSPPIIRNLLNCLRYCMFSSGDTLLTPHLLPLNPNNTLCLSQYLPFGYRSLPRLRLLFYRRVRPQLLTIAPDIQILTLDLESSPFSPSFIPPHPTHLTHPYLLSSYSFPQRISHWVFKSPVL
jgi:hypothetical protein